VHNSLALFPSTTSHYLNKVPQQIIFGVHTQQMTSPAASNAAALPQPNIELQVNSQPIMQDWSLEGVEHWEQPP